MQQPADISRELLGLWPWKQHAVIERVQELRFRHPLFFVDDDAMHERDLAGWATEAEAANLEPDTRGLGEGNRQDHIHDCDPLRSSAGEHATASRR